MFKIDPVYQVGGCVRDHIMGLISSDYDYTTPVLPDDMEAILKEQGKRVYTVGKRFGTIGFKDGGDMIEITTFRTETYNNNRKPDVTFVTDIKEDLSRRDFTINAMAIKEGTNNIIDPFGGQQDIENGIIRCVGNPDTRFKEDPLRLLRAIRFASRFGFTIEDKTWKILQKKAHRILLVSRERWMIELEKILMDSNANYGLELLMESRLFNYMIPELSLQYNYDQNSPWHQHTLWVHTRAVVENFRISDYATKVCRDEHYAMMWACLLHDIAKPFVRVEKVGRSTYAKHEFLGGVIVDDIGRRLKWSNDLRERVVHLVANHMNDESPMRPFDKAAH